MNVCPTCNHENRSHARFCAGCGAPLGDPAGSPPATPTVVPEAQPPPASESRAPSTVHHLAARWAYGAQEPERVPHIVCSSKARARTEQHRVLSQRPSTSAPRSPVERRARLEFPITELGRRPLREAFRLARRLARLLSRLHRSGYHAFGGSEPLDQLLLAALEEEFFKPAGARQYQPLPREARERAALIAGDLRFFARAIWFWLTGQDPKRFDLGQVPGLPKPLAVILCRAWEGDYASGGELLAEMEQLAALVEQPTQELRPHITRPVTRPPTMTGAASYRAAYRTDTGHQRASNEDRAWVGPVPGGYLCVVCDGMGGHEAGEVAAEMALATIRQHFETALAQSDSAADPGALLTAALTEANRQVFEGARAQAPDMGTTAVAALVIGSSVHFASAGDSRAYLFRAGQLTQVTQDHSLVASLVLASALAPEEVYSHPRRNEIYRFLGNKGDLVLDPIPPVRLRVGDLLLLCSDGLWEMVRDPQIAQVLVAEPEPDAACERLIQLANEQGGEDNVSVVILKVERKEQ